MASQSTSPFVILSDGTLRAFQRRPRPGTRLVPVRRPITARTETELRDLHFRRLAGNPPCGNRRMTHPPRTAACGLVRGPAAQALPRLRSTGATGAGSARTDFDNVRR